MAQVAKKKKQSRRTTSQGFDVGRMDDQEGW